MAVKESFSIDLLNLLSSDQGVYNRQIAKSIGLLEAVFFAEIVYKYKYFMENGGCEEINNEFWFYTTYESIFEKTGLTKEQCMRIVPSLVNHGLIKTIDKGIPKKKYYTLNLEDIYKKVYYKSGKPTSRGRESPPQAVGKTHFIHINEQKETNMSCSVNSKNSGPSIRNISKKNTKGDPVSITYEEIFRRCVFEKKDWSIPEIEEAWDILNDYDKPVSDLFALMESIVENQRTNKTKQKRKQQEEKNKPKLSKGPAVCTEPPGKPIPKEMWGKPTL